MKRMCLYRLRFPHLLSTQSSRFSESKLIRTQAFNPFIIQTHFMWAPLMLCFSEYSCEFDGSYLHKIIIVCKTLFVGEMHVNLSGNELFAE